MIGLFFIVSISFLFFILNMNNMGIVLLITAILYLLFYVVRGKNKKNNELKYLISFNAISSKILINVIKANLIDGEILISQKMIKKIFEDSDKMYNKKNLLENLDYIKRYSKFKEINIDFNITYLFKYAFENNIILIISGEKVSENVSKIFNIKTIDLSILRKECKEIYVRGKKIKFIVSKNANNCEGFLINNNSIFLKDCNNYENGRIYEGIVENSLEIKNKRIFTLKGKKDEE